MAHKCEHNLCYNYNEKWAPSHKCKARFFLLVADKDDPGPDHQTQSPTSPDTNILDPTLAQISFNALSGTSTPYALRLFGFIHHLRVNVLIDGGSTHNFIQARVAKHLHLPTIPTAPLQVTVGNNIILPCDQFCPQTPLSLQGHAFTVDFHILPLSEVDIVLGIQWLKQLGPIITDYDTLTM